MTPDPRISRLAPSPTGALHLGNIRTFLINWAIARNAGWTLLMRIEDLDGPRVKADTDRQVLDLLAWLGIDHDGTPVWQSHDLEPYRAALRMLADDRRLYACRLTRSEIAAAATAPHGDEHELRCPPELRPGEPEHYRFEREDTNYRIVIPDEPVTIEDQLAGTHVFHPFGEVGDVVLWTRRASPSYQLAVVVDDARQGVTDVVRGADLLPSAARQTLVYRALGLRPPRWWHVPLVVGPDGRRLAKRHGDTRVEAYRRDGVRPQRIIGLLAAWSGVVDRPEVMSAEEFRAGFRPGRLPREPVVFTEDDERWLRGA